MGKIIYNPIIIIVFTLLSALFLLSLRKSAEKTQVSNESIENLELEIDELRKNLEKTKWQAEQAQSPIEKEKIIRNELLMQKEGEYIIKLPEITIEESEDEVVEKKPADEWRELLITN